MTRIVTLAAALVLGACGLQAQSPPGVALDEFSVDVQGAVGTGTFSLPVHNDGQFGHTVVVTEAGGSVVTATDLIAPGETIDLELDLEPGDYQFTCRIVVETPDGGIIDHYAEGMSASVVVGGA